MRRRTFLATGATLSLASAAGCFGLLDTQSATGPPAVLDDRPDAVYFPTHVEGMEMVGTAVRGDYEFGLMYSYAHRFWNVNGSEVEKTAIDSADDVHLMASVWEPETGTVLPETGLSVSIGKQGEDLREEVIYPMLSQPMGFHYGGNFSLDGDGTYTVRVSVGGMADAIARTGAFEGLFGEQATVDVEMEYSDERKEEIMYERYPDRAGERDAYEPMEMEMVPNSLAPERSALPGRVLGTATSGDAVLVATAIEDADRFPGDGTYLAVSTRTPYNRMVVPAARLTATLTRDDETAFEGALTRTLDPELDYHYGASVGRVESGDALRVSVDTIPQVARHEGYETAFVEMDPVEFSVP